MKYILWLDDDTICRNPNNLMPKSTVTWKENYFLPEYQGLSLIWVKTYQEFVYCITKNGLPQMISFDNDLGRQLEGKDCAKWLFAYLVDTNYPFPTYDISVHSANPVAAQEISNILVYDWNKYWQIQNKKD
jgi:hypothetical protein